MPYFTLFIARVDFCLESLINIFRHVDDFISTFPKAGEHNFKMYSCSTSNCFNHKFGLLSLFDIASSERSLNPL